MPSTFKPRQFLLACSILLLCLPASAAATAVADPPVGVASGPCVEGICEYTLDNGLRVLLFADASKPTVTVNITYGVGSVHENYGETGMAHLLEHLVFKGTPRHGDISAEMKKRGIGFNATTSLDRTNYFASFPADDANLDWVLGMEADRMVNSFIAQKDLDSEMTVVRNEMERNENSPVGVLFQRVRSAAYLWHNYGNSTIGARSDVENVPIETLQAFYRQWYRPDNATLVVAGRIDPAATLAKVHQTFGSVPTPAQPMPAAYTAEPTQDGEREITVRRSGDTRALVAAWHVPSVNHPDSAAMAVLLDILGDTPSGRLHKSLVETRLAAASGASSDGLRQSGLASAVAIVPIDGDAARAEAELLRQVEQLPPVTAGEVELARQRIANAYERNLANVNAVAMGLTSAVAAGDWRLYFLRRDLVAKVTADDVNRVARAYFKPSNRTLGRFIPTDKPDRALIPAAPAVATLLDGFVGKPAVAAGETFEPSPDNIQARTRSFVIGDGLKVSLLPRDTRGDTVSVTASFRFGDEASLRGRMTAASFAGQMLMRDSQGLDREQIAQRLEALNTTGGVGGGAQSASINFSSRRGTVAEALALAAQLLRTPGFPEDEFEQLRLQHITSIEAARKEPGTVAGQALAKRFDPWPQGHALSHRSLDQVLAEIKALQLEDVRAFHREFYGSAHGEIAIVGDFDADAVQQQLETLFAGWRSDRPYAPIRTRHAAVAAERQQLPTPDKSSAVVLARSNVALNDADADYPALMVANHVLGSSALASRLGDRLRQKEGLTYGVSSSLRADASPDGVDNAGSLDIQAIAAPENVARLEVGLREELDRLVRDGVTAVELKDAVDGLLVRFEQSRASDASVAGMLSRNLYMDRTMAWTADFESRLRGLTVVEVNAAMARHLKPEALSVFAAGDFAERAGAATQRP
ncbi:MAG: insulinase family protein [Pseudomonadota bacterium]|nr:insulinase family protein [Pseudomonadota bacterium]